MSKFEVGLLIEGATLLLIAGWAAEQLNWIAGELRSIRHHLDER